MSSQATLPKNFLAQANRFVKVERVDFSKTDTPGYAGSYAVILDNVLSKAECEQLVAAAGDDWARAMVNIGQNREQLQTERRKCERIIFDNREVAAKIWDRIKDHVPELHTIEQQPQVTGPGPAKRKEVWKMARLNERMRFLKYGAGEYFRKHCDGTYETLDKTERSMFTLHLYLNEADARNNLVGGATTFHDLCTCKKSRWDMCDCVTGSFDVDPKVGRVLLFQQRGLEHSGAQVDDGIKMTMRTDLLFSKV